MLATLLTLSASGCLEVENTGIVPTLDFLTDGKIVAFIVREGGAHGGDENGDGDTNDHIMHIYEARTGETISLALESDSSTRSNEYRGFLTADRLVAFPVSEWRQGNTDLNGDGDATDHVLHVYDVASRTVINLGAGIVGIGRYDFFTAGRRVAYLSSEWPNDLNHDGDVGDAIWHVYDADTGATTVLPLASVQIEYKHFAMDANRLAFVVPEHSQGQSDLNGDGNAWGNILHVWEADTGEIINVGYNVSTFLDNLLYEDTLVFGAQESPTLGVDYNNDGDFDDHVTHVFDLESRTTTNLGIAMATQRFGAGFIVQDSNLVAIAVLEKEQGETDLDADGDALDMVLYVHDVQSHNLRNLGLAVKDFKPFYEQGIAANRFFVDGEAGRVFFAVDEQGQGGTDLDGNGQTTDAVLHMYDASSGDVLNLGLPIEPLTVDGDGRRFAVTVPESAAGGIDLNADGDLEDPVLHVYRADRGLLNLGVLAYGVYVDDSLVAFAGDGGLQIYDFGTRQILDVGLVPRVRTDGAPTVVGSRVVFTAVDVGGELHVATVRRPGLLPPRMGSSLTELKALQQRFRRIDNTSGSPTGLETMSP